MAESINMKEVMFSEYCKSCVYRNLNENKDPCDECLSYGMRPFSHKPYKYRKGVNRIGKGK